MSSESRQSELSIKHKITTFFFELYSERTHKRLTIRKSKFVTTIMFNANELTSSHEHICQFLWTQLFLKILKIKKKRM